LVFISLRFNQCNEFAKEILVNNDVDEITTNQTINSRKKTKYNHSDIYSYIINPGESICGDDYGENLLLISLSPSIADFYDRRMAIRNTWSNKFIYKNTRNVFIFGLSLNNTQNAQIKAESDFYGDIIQVNFIDFSMLCPTPLFSF
jgi:hypothetical protein